jgi:prepilin-type N-terminal cleavage/methylation domain-containing protein
MKIQSNKKRKHGFTLIEMIGVLAVIAILAALLIPKIFEAINNARINNACISVNTIKTALADHYAKYGSLDSGLVGGVPAALTLSSGVYADYDKLLLTEAFIDKPFEVKVSTSADIRLIKSIALAAPSGSNELYDLDGDGTADVFGTSTSIIEAVLNNVAPADALEISKRLDGDNMSEAASTTDDDEGRVKYAIASGVATMHIYLTHR